MGKIILWPSLSASPVTPQPFLPELDDYHDGDDDEALTGTSIARHNPCARIVFMTSGTQLRIKAVSTAASIASMRKMVITVNDVVDQVVTTDASGAEQTYDLTLPVGDAKRVAVWEGPFYSPEPNVQSGGILTSVEVLDASLTKVAPVGPEHRVVVIGDSISQGYPYSPDKGWPGLLRTDATVDAQVTLFGATARQFYQDTVTTTVPVLAAKLAAQLADVAPGGVEDLIFALGTNDWGDGANFVAYFEEHLADLIDAVHAARPDATIRLLAPIVRQDEAVPNSRGEILQEYRDAMDTIASARGPWCVYFDASSVLTLGQLGDGVHPTEAGYVILKNYVRDTVIA